jgi:Tol biopolymer transport system component
LLPRRLSARDGNAEIYVMNADGTVNTYDFNRLKSFLGKSPGPSGLARAGNRAFR